LRIRGDLRDTLRRMNSLVRRVAHSVENFATSRLTQPWRRHRHFEEQYVGRLLSELKVDCVLDVGANTGGYALMLREYSYYQGLIISFEPTPDVLEGLRRNSEKDRLWHVEPVALANSTGRAKFRAMPACSSEGNSFLPLKQEDQPEIEEIEVEVRRLADILPDLRRKFGFSRPFLKMDTQGFDLEVFAGAREVLPEIVGLQSELSVDPFYAGAPGWIEALGVYQQAGFTLSTLVANNLDWFPRARELDCIMYRPEAWESAKKV
jgi:FkbM family methyltransferase